MVYLVFTKRTFLGWARTSDLPVNSRALCQLSYEERKNQLMISATGIEPVTLRYPCLQTLQSDALPIELR